MNKSPEIYIAWRDHDGKLLCKKRAKISSVEQKKTNTLFKLENIKFSFRKGKPRILGGESGGRFFYCMFGGETAVKSSYYDASPIILKKRDTITLVQLALSMRRDYIGKP